MALVLLSLYYYKIRLTSRPFFWEKNDRSWLNRDRTRTIRKKKMEGKYLGVRSSVRKGKKNGSIAKIRGETNIGAGERRKKAQKCCVRCDTIYNFNL